MFFCQQMESSVSSGGGLENDTLLVVPPSEKSTHLTEGSIAGIVLGCIAAVVAFSKLQFRFCMCNHLTLCIYTGSRLQRVRLQRLLTCKDQILLHLFTHCKRYPVYLFSSE